MSSWYPAPSINSLVRDLDSAFPGRVQPDWIIGDADHSSRSSDHNPDSSGMVHAIDIRLGGPIGLIENGQVSEPAKRILNAVIGDPRVWYVIFNSKIYSRTYGWEARRYTGSNPHTTHIHVSIRYTNAAEQDTSPWGFLRQTRRTRPRPIDLSVVQAEFKKALGLQKGQVRESAHVKRLQRALNTRDNAGLKVDGVVGPKLLRAWGRWERDAGGQHRPRVPDRVSLGRLVQPRWRMVA